MPDEQAEMHIHVQTADLHDHTEEDEIDVESL
jgi:hypothetical protein